MGLAKAVAWRAPRVITIAYPTNAAILTSGNVAAFIADGDYELVSVQEVHETLGTDGSAVTLDVVKATSTTTIANGTSMLASTFSLKATINTVVEKAISNAGLATSQATRQIAKGNRVGIKLGGVLTSVTGVNVTLVFIPILRRMKW